VVKRIAVWFAVLLCIILVIGTASCSDSGAKAKQTVRDYWSAMQKGDYATAKTYLTKTLSTSTLDEVTNSNWKSRALLFDEIRKSTSIEIEDSTVSGDNAKVNVKATMLDLDIQDFIHNAILANLSFTPGPNDVLALADGDYIEAFKSQLPKIKDTPKVTKEVELSLVLEGGNWKIKANMLFEDVINSINKAMGI